jgi:putative transposase
VQGSPQVCKGSCYRWQKERITIRQKQIIAIKDQITSIYFESKQRYGIPRITLELQSLGYKISKPESFARTGEAITVAKYMKQLGLKSKLNKKFKVTTNSNHNYLVVKMC